MAEAVMHSFRIGKLFGIQIRVDYSWLFIFVLLTWNLTSVFSTWHPDWPGYEPSAVGLAASLIFFACVLVHELAHSLVARRYGLAVRSITLFLFGGVSNIEHEPPSPGSEFFIALVGPVTSIVLGIVFVALAGASTGLSLPQAGTTGAEYASLTPLETLLAWLGPINFVIGVFNLIPAFPLDGGRVLRSIVWKISGDLRKSTRGVAGLGRLFGGLFIVLGIAMTFGAHVAFFGTGIGAGLWLAFIGWFLHSAASQSTMRLAMDDAFAGHTVEEIMRRGGTTVPPDMPIGTLVHEYFLHSDERALAVVDDGRLLGLVSLSDVRAVPLADWPTTPVSRVMRADPSLAIATPDEPVARAFDQLAQQNIEQLPVVDHGQLVGMLQRRDVTRWLELSWRPAGAR